MEVENADTRQSNDNVEEEVQDQEFSINKYVGCFNFVQIIIWMNLIIIFY